MKTNPTFLKTLLPLGAGFALSGQTWGVDITTADGNGFDGTLTEINYSGVYDGGFDTTSYRNNVYQNGNLRHLLIVLKFDVSASGLSGDDVSSASITLTAQGSSGNVRGRNLELFLGDDSLIDENLRYDAANPFIDDAYPAEGEVVGDVDFATGTTQNLLTFNNTSDEGTTVTFGDDNADFLAAVKEALDGDGFLTFIIHGGNSQYLPYSDNDTDVNRMPTLTLVSNLDTDNDDLPDDWEISNFGDITTYGKDDDPDSDGFSNIQEFEAGSNPDDFFSIPGDIDGDELTDLWEDEWFGNNDGVIDEAELALQSGLDDPDGDFGDNTAEEEAGTDPQNALDFLDEDNGGSGDGLNDWWENHYFFNTTTATDPAGDNDGDGDTNQEEYEGGSDPNWNQSVVGDIDGDTLPDGWELQYFGNLTTSDFPEDDLDGDGATNFQEATATPVPSDPNNINSVPGDSDGDQLQDDWELTYFLDLAEQNGLHDPDGDLYTNEEEETAGTDPLDESSFLDSDGDELNDRWEEEVYGAITVVDDASDDSDGDGATAQEEYLAGSDPNNGDSGPGDRDGDGLDDEFEEFYFGTVALYGADDDPDGDFATNLEEQDNISGETSPTLTNNAPDNDGEGGFGDGLGDAWEIHSFGDTSTTDDPGERDLEDPTLILSGDPDGDGYLNSEEFAAGSNGNDPLSTPDTDGDGLPEGWERSFFNGDETTQTGQDDSDSDGHSNLLEYLAGTDPSDASSTPNPGILSTELGRGADTDLANDDQNTPDSTFGEVAAIAIRNNRSSRLHIPLLRFDISLLSGDLSQAALRLHVPWASSTGGTINVYGLLDGSAGEDWDETSTSYANAPGIIEAERGVRNVFASDPRQVVLLGTFTPNGEGVFISNPKNLDLSTFLERDEDGLVTLFLDASNGNRWHGITMKEHESDPAPALVLPFASVNTPVTSGLEIDGITVDPSAGETTLKVAGLSAGQDYHLETLQPGAMTFSPLAESTFTATGSAQDIILSTDFSTTSTLLIRVKEGSAP
ncbi:DUF7594 domain-containing protein [Roseibacillus ishigakijimensis]|uniref:Carbohydrate-binding module family 96 domain-containing protein n=1 Tax=Roseibacillus ishigakijimensis TaxID=454146 RepID=A0A934VN73_9BACT|nr:hypothetical protein [Roseibacillus ishigakijimensis]MBK1834725.1 hypothetical protein [Roseibacillus ishigakijimensis]